MPADHVGVGSAANGAFLQVGGALGWRSAAGFEFPDFQHEFRRDDGAGPAVIARLRALQPGDESLSHVTLALSDGEPGRMIDLWEGARLAVVIDAVTRLPARLTVLAVVGRDFGFGTELTAEVAAAVAELVEQVREIVRWPAAGGTAA